MAHPRSVKNPDKPDSFAGESWHIGCAGIMMTVMRQRIAIALALSIASGGYASAAVEVKFLHRLSNFSGVLPYSDPQIHADRYNDEVYVGEGDSIRVFNAAGMQIFEFVHDAMNLGSAVEFATTENGDIFILSYCSVTMPCREGAIVTVCNYRGEPQRSFSLAGLPEALASFTPNRMLLRNKKLVFASTTALLVVVTDLEGNYESHTDLLAGLELENAARDGAQLGGFDVDARGTILYTIPTAFRAFRRKPGENVESWGKSGTARGNFGIAGAITQDDAGNIIVSDRARGVILVFGPNLLFLREFGSAGPREARLRGPGRVALGNGGKLYITQLGMRGVSVFSLTPP